MRKKYVYYLHKNFVSLDLFSVQEENRYVRKTKCQICFGLKKVDLKWISMGAPSFEGRAGYFVANFEIELANLFNSFVTGREDV